MKKSNILRKFGFEIEAEVIRWKVKPSIYDYKKGSPAQQGSHLIFERDSSLSSFHGGDPVEIKSTLLYSRRGVDLFLKELSEYVGEFYCNPTCGLHFHFSTSGEINKFYFTSLYDLRSLFVKNLRKNVVPSLIIKSISRNYVRDYAKMYLSIDERYTSVNLSLNGWNHIEWRSPNAVGVDNFGDLRKVLYAIIDSVEDYIILFNSKRLLKRELYELELQGNAVRVKLDSVLLNYLKNKVVVLSKETEGRYCVKNTYADMLLHSSLCRRYLFLKKSFVDELFKDGECWYKHDNAIDALLFFWDIQKALNIFQKDAKRENSNKEVDVNVLCSSLF